jgi:hypothetical protein
MDYHWITLFMQISALSCAKGYHLPPWANLRQVSHLLALTK